MNTKRLIGSLLLALALGGPLTAAAGEIAVVVDRDNPTAGVSVDELRSIFLGKKKDWADGTRIVPIDLTPGADRDVFNVKVLGKSQSDVDQYWVEQKVRGGEAAPKAAPSAALAVKLVAKIRGAVAYVPVSAVDGSVKVLAVGGAQSIK